MVTAKAKAEEEVRTVVLNTLELTRSKEKKLDTLLDQCLVGTEYLLAAVSYSKLYCDKLSRYTLQEKTYEYLKQNLTLQSQVIIDLTKDVFAASLTGGFRFDNYSVSFNVPRSGKLAVTKKGNPVISVAVLPRKRIGIPIAQDGAWRRFNTLLDEGYTWSAFKIAKNLNGWKLLISMKRRIPKSEYSAILGIDVGSRCLAAATLVSEADGIKQQLYFGRDLYDKQRDISLRRSKLQQYKDKGVDKEKAAKKLKTLKSKERNYTKTRCYQIAHQIVDIAKQNGAKIAIEDLGGLKNTKLRRKSNRRVKRMPYNTFRLAVESVAKRTGITVVTVNPRYTSKWCPKCGSFGKRKGKGKEFVCKNCGRKVNADRNASLNIALRAAAMHDHNMILESQNTKGYDSVNSREWYDEGEGVKSWHGYLAPEYKPTTLVVGS